MPSISAVGSAFLVNQQTADNQFQGVTTTRAEGFAAFWSGPVLPVSGTAAAYANADIKGRLFSSDGTPAGDEFTVNATTAGIQFRSKAATLSDGNFIVVWQEGIVTTVPGNGTTAIKAQKFSADGVPIGSELLLSGQAVLDFPNIAALGDGGFVATWLKNDSVVAQRYDATNTAVGGEITVGGGQVEFGRTGLTALSNGNIVITYTKSDFTGGSAFVFDAAGNQVGPEISYAISESFLARTIALTDGGFVLTTAFSFGNIGYSIRNADGTLRAEGVLGSGSLGYDIAATPTGDFVVAYGIDRPDLGPSATAIEARLVRGNGNLGGAAVTVNELTSGSQNNPVLSSLANGDLVVAWSDQTADGSGFGIRGRVLDFNTANTAPVAQSDLISSLETRVVGVAALLANDLDADGDTLTVISVGNARSGQVSLVDGVITFTPDAGFTGPSVFDYTISDGTGATATATVTLSDSVNDVASVRGVGPHFIDVLSNDRLPLPQFNYVFSATVPQNGGSIRFVDTFNGQQLVYSPLQTDFPDYFNLLVNQSSEVVGTYSVIDPATGEPVVSATVTIRLEGWAQLGGGEADNLVGGSLADHLSGGTGAANTLSGGAGDDYYTVQAAGDVVIEGAFQGMDTVRTSLAAFQLPDNVENLQAGFNGAAGDFSGVGNADNNKITGGLGNDVLSGLDGDDVLSGGVGNDVLISGSGMDFLFGGDGNDGLFFGAFLDGADSIDGGEGIDQVGLQGNYNSSLTVVSARNALGVEQFVLLPGNDTRFGAPGNQNFSYNIFTFDDAIPAGQQLIFQANTLRAGENFTLSASGELDGLVFTYGGQGNDRINGGQTGDAFFFGTGRFNAGDFVDGQGGIDQIGLQGSYSGASAIVLSAGQIFNVEVIVLLTNSDTRFGGVGSTPFSYDLTTDNTTVAPGARLAIQANTLTSSEVLRFNGAGETDGSFSIFSGNGNDVITGSRNGDTISGRGGADTLTGGGGNDIFLYTNISDSTAAARDMITDFASGDRIDLSRIDAITGGSDDGFTLIGDAGFSNVAGQLRVNSLGDGIFAVEGDINGDGAADFSIWLTNTDAHVITAADFVL